MNNQELLYKIATDQRFADTFRLAIQVQQQLKKIAAETTKTEEKPKETKKVDFQGAMRRGREAAAAKKKKKDNKSGTSAAGGTKTQPIKKDQPSTQESPKDTNNRPEYEAGLATGQAQTLSQAIHAIIGSTLGNYVGKGLGWLTGKGVGELGNIGGRNMVSNMGRTRAAAGPTANGAKVNYTTQYVDAGGHPITAAQMRTNMANYSDAVARTGANIGKWMGRIGGGVGGFVLANTTNNWLSDYIKSKMGNIA